MDDTTPIAYFRTGPGAEAAAALLRANAIRCAVVELPTPLTGVLPWGMTNENYALVVAREDADRAREATAGCLDAAWFLRTADGRRVHAFERATADGLRRHAATEADRDGWAARDCRRLADLLDARQAAQVSALLGHDGLIEGRSLAEWARACGCEPVERP
jgi:hypothetical protein